MPKRITIQDVARQAGVSNQTVSRVINGKPDVAPETRDRIQQIIDRLGYRPSSVARSLVSQRTRTLTLIASSLDEDFYVQVMAGAEQEARRHGYVFLLSIVEPEARHDSGEWRVVSERQVDGVFVASPELSHRAYIDWLIEQGTPVVAVAHPPQAGLITLNVDNVEGGYVATRYLVSRGHRRIGTIPGVDNGRTAGYKRALEEAGLAFEPDLVQGGDWSYRSGFDAMQRLLRIAPDLTAVFAQNDQMAIGAMHALCDAGRRVPDDVAVVGFDDIPAAAFACPPLTTIRQPMREIGRIAARTLLERIRHPEMDRKEMVFKTQFIRRASA